MAASPASPDSLSLATLSVEDRERIARHVDRLVSERVYHLLRERATRANAEYRFMDLMDRHVLGLTVSLIFLVAAYLVAAELAVRGLALLGGAALARPLIALVWAGLLLGLPAFLFGRVRTLYRRASGLRLFPQG